MGLIDLPSSTDFIESVDWVIPSDHRDFSRSTTDWAIGSQDSNLPIMDGGFADDGDAFTKQVQSIMKNPSALGLSFFAYAGPIDGKKSGKWYNHLKNVLTQFGWALQKKFPGQKIPIMITGSGISQGGFNAAMALLSGKSPIKTEEDSKGKIPAKDAIKSFQLFFSKAQPVIGKLYSGTSDGEMNEELAAAAQIAESAIAKAINDKTVNGKLFNVGSKTFNTSVYDLSEALNLIQRHQNKENIAFFDSKNRILALSAIINQ